MNNTDYMVLGVIALLLLWEGYTLLNTTPDDTISASVWKVSKRPLVPFLVGMLCGHFFWQSW